MPLAGFKSGSAGGSDEGSEGPIALGSWGRIRHCVNKLFILMTHETLPWRLTGRGAQTIILHVDEGDGRGSGAG